MGDSLSVRLPHRHRYSSLPSEATTLVVLPSLSDSSSLLPKLHRLRLLFGSPALLNGSVLYSYLTSLPKVVALPPYACRYALILRLRSPINLQLYTWRVLTALRVPVARLKKCRPVYNLHLLCFRCHSRLTFSKPPGRYRANSLLSTRLPVASYSPIHTPV